MTAERRASRPGAVPVAVTGAAGKTGRAVTAALAARGIPVRALVHRAEQAAAGVPGAAETLAVDLADRAGVGAALDGVGAVYLIAPNVHPDEPGLLRAAIETCAAGGPGAVVYHSVIHPYVPDMPHHVDKAEVEAMLQGSGLHWSILQPASYFENALGVWDSVRGDGVWPLPYSDRSQFTPVALADVAEVAAQVLEDALRAEPRHRYATYELAGPEVLSTADMAAVAADVLGRDVTVTVARPADPPADPPATTPTTPTAPAAPTTPTALADRPADPRVVARVRLHAMFAYYDAHGICGNPTVLGALLGRAPRSWREWVGAHR